MMKINESMIVLDLDKTLLNRENQIIEYTLKVLDKYRECFLLFYRFNTNLLK